VKSMVAAHVAARKEPTARAVERRSRRPWNEGAVQPTAARNKEPDTAVYFSKDKPLVCENGALCPVSYKIGAPT